MTLQAYVRAVRNLLLQVPGTSGCFSRSDRLLARDLYQRGISWDLLRSAILLATARRVYRDPSRPGLTPIRSLHYFLPALDEILHQPLPQSYVHYLEARLALKE